MAFIEANRERPFFVYLAHTMPHVPIFASERFRGRSKQGLYGDVIEEIDDSVGQVLAALRRLGLERDTLVIFASDNGPWLSYGDHAGSAGPLREGKGTAFEGGVRVPFVARWPGHIPAGTVVREPAMTIDVLPTIARLVGAPLPERPIDGLDISPLLLGEAGARSPHEALLFYYGTELRAVRGGRYKLVLPHRSQTLDGPGGLGRDSREVQAGGRAARPLRPRGRHRRDDRRGRGAPGRRRAAAGARREGPRGPRRLADEPDRPRPARAGAGRPAERVP